MAPRKRFNPYWTPDDLNRAGRRPSREVDTTADEMPFVRVAKAAVGVIHDAIQRIGSAVIGPDQSGNARGANAFDLQAARSDATYVASGDDSIAIGNNNRASGLGSSAIGQNNLVDGLTAIAVGADNQSSSDLSVAVGVQCLAQADRAVALGSAAVANAADALAFGSNCESLAAYSSAIGASAIARISKTVVFGGAHIIVHGSNAPPESWFLKLSGVQVILTSAEIDLKIVTDYTLTLPSGCKFWLDEVGVIVTALDTLVVQPTVRFGISGTPAKHKAAAITTLLTAVSKREKWTPLVPEDGEVSLSFGVTVGATATTLKGRAYWKGILVENEP
jgi:hypothetical protein